MVETVSFFPPTGLGFFHVLTVQRLFQLFFHCQIRRMRAWLLARYFTDKILWETSPMTLEISFKRIVF